MKTVVLTVALLLASSSLSARADAPKCEGEQCFRSECFNLVCSYRENRPTGYRECSAAAEFQKKVRLNGDEVRDHSAPPFNPKFEVLCDETLIFNNSAHRFTGHAGTRIQAVQGPYPAIILPKHSLRDGHRYVPSTLELPGQLLEGYCFVYTGPAL